MKRIPIEKRFWGVANPEGDVVPHSVSYHKWLALKRFIETPNYGMGKTWPHWRKRGWRLVRLKIEERAKS
jgi:hypothetical protein